MAMSSPYNQGLFEESVSAVTATNSVQLGSKRVVGGREYTYVYNAGSTAAVQVAVCLTGTSGYSVVVTMATTSTTCFSPTLFGVVREAELTASQYGWVVTRGHVDIKSNGSAAIAAGDLLILAENGTVRPYSAVSVITQLVYMAAGNAIKAMTATDATAGTVGVFIR
jgi:hypothetical protein